MAKRLTHNSNLTVSNETIFNDYEVLYLSNGWFVEYLASIHKTFNKAIGEHRRTYAVRFELVFPMEGEYRNDDAVITRFFASFKAKLQNDDKIKSQENKRVHSSTLRYVWCKERNTSLNYHYHVLIFLNHDRYWRRGEIDFNNDRWLSTKIAKAWNSALGLGADYPRHSVHFPSSCEYRIDVNSPRFEEGKNELLKRASYLAKVDTKIYANSPENEFILGKPGRSFGCSQR